MDLTKLLLVVACMAPLFLLLAVRGVGAIAWEIYFPVCLLLAILPNIYFFFRIWRAKTGNDRKEIVVNAYTDNREHLLTYVFAMLIPLYQAGLATDADLYSAMLALIFVVFIFGHMDLYYMNFFFALGRYRVLTIPADPNSAGFSAVHVLITRRISIKPGTKLTPLRLTDFLLFDE